MNGASKSCNQPPCLTAQPQQTDGSHDRSHLDLEQLRRDSRHGVFGEGREEADGLAHHSRLQDVAAAAVLAKPAVVHVHHRTRRLEVESH